MVLVIIAETTQDVDSEMVFVICKPWSVDLQAHLLNLALV